MAKQVADFMIRKKCSLAGMSSCMYVMCMSCVNVCIFIIFILLCIFISKTALY